MGEKGNDEDDEKKRNAKNIQPLHEVKKQNSRRGIVGRIKK
jgi:hypothetical protein